MIIKPEREGLDKQVMENSLSQANWNGGESLLDPSLTSASLLPFLWLADDADSLSIVRTILGETVASTAEKGRLEKFISSRLEELIPDGQLREIRGPAFMIKEAREAIVSGNEEAIAAFLEKYNHRSHLAKSIARQELLRSQHGESVFYDFRPGAASCFLKWKKQRDEARQSGFASNDAALKILKSIDEGCIVYVFPPSPVFGAAWRLDESRIAISATYTGNTPTGFIDTHWISRDSIKSISEIFALIWPCFGSPERYKYVAQVEAEIRLGLVEPPRKTPVANIDNILSEVRQDWMRREYKIFSMRMYSIPLLAVAMENGDNSSSWLTGSTRSYSEGSAYYDPRVRDASTPVRRSEVASAWAHELISSPSYVFRSEELAENICTVWSKLEQLEWMSGRPASAREWQKGLFMSAEEAASRLREQELTNSKGDNDEWVED